MTTPTLPRGIDVSSHQGNPDWDAVAASGISFAISKVTEDDGYVNPTHERNWREMKRVGLVRGAYHFAYPDQSLDDAEREADFFLLRVTNTGGLEEGDFLVLDLESGSGDLGEWALAFLRRVEASVGFKPFIYTAPWFAKPHGLTLHPELADYGLWQAAYQDEQPDPLTPWPFIAIWQHSDKGQVPGIDGDVDLNVFNGPLDRLKLYGKPAAAPAPAPDPRDARIAELEAHAADLQSHLDRILARLKESSDRILEVGL